MVHGAAKSSDSDLRQSVSVCNVLVGLPVPAEFFDQLIEFFSTLAGNSVGFPLRLALFGLFFKAFTNLVHCVLTVLCRDFASRLAVEMMADSGFFHCFQVTQ